MDKKIKCDCGGNFVKSYLKKHIKSDLHQKYISKPIGSQFYYYWNGNSASLVNTKYTKEKIIVIRKEYIDELK